ncbi:TMEM165/GDT1 family protein [Acetivibrio cellulolyticus]|uniref:TMEM165/GDT1 family protein n=1 Tax=Acetivibrio cellulolyticus TaxID=35830 RepID=UPI0001E2C7D1|nr:TMEM165/GDT1 family protein [Acetivibrio cellulolyticus]
MYTSLVAFLAAVGTVVLAEMGDKTQLLAMAFATKYKASKVMIGVFIATVLNHGLAVAVGNFITHFSGAQIWISGIASLSFIFFGLWTIRGDKLEGEENRTTKFGPVATVAFAFFLAEMGDKTQLATIALATKFPTSPAGILIGTTTGMLIADGIGIIIGVVMCKRIPERTIKLVSACLFILFGLIGSFQVAHDDLQMGTGAIIAAMAVIIVITGFAAYYLIKKDNANRAENADVAEYCKVKIQEPSSDTE